MFVPPGFRQHFITTALGKMVYYTNEAAPWNIETGQELVFFHGFGGGSSAYEWSKVYPAFASEYRVLAPDLIGWGRSEHPERSYQIEDYVLVLNEFLEKNCTSPTQVIASGLTAAFTIRAAIERPDLYQSLVLTTAAGLREFESNYPRNFFTQVVSIPVLDKLLYNAGVSTEFGIRNFLEQNQFARAERISPELIQAYQQSAQQPNAEYAALAFVRGDLCFDLSQYVPQLTVPTALIWGQKSEFTGPDVGRRLAEMNPQAIRFFQQLDDVGLTPQLELPAVTIGLIRKFLPLLKDNQNPQTDHQDEQTDNQGYPAFLQSVQALDFIQDRDTADAAIKAVLGHVASRLEEAIARQFVAKLPEPLSFETLRGHQETVTEISASQFLVDLCQQFDISQEQAESLVQQVFKTAKETTGKDFSVVEAELPFDWTEMIAEHN